MFESIDILETVSLPLLDLSYVEIEVLDIVDSTVDVDIVIFNGIYLLLAYG